MSEETWHEARLIPTSGINGSEEQERRATSALLAVLGAVREFGRAVLQPFGAPAGRVESYIEVPFLLGERRVYPDGLVRVRRGQKVWTALIEVKTGSAVLETTQLENYLDVARQEGFDALITISSEIPPAPGQHPTTVDGRKLRDVALHHLSWSQVLTEAVVQREHRGVADPDQAWILSELIRYLEHPRSGALQFEDMGSWWVPVRDAVAAGTLRAGDRGINDVTGRFDGLMQYLGLNLGRRLGVDVVPALSRREQQDPAQRTQALSASLIEQGQLCGALKIPGAVGPLVVTGDLRAGRVTCHVDLEAPGSGRPSTRVGWLVRQLASAPGSVRVEAFTTLTRTGGTAELLSAVRDDPARLVADPARELRAFRVALDQPLGTKRGRGRGSFIDSVTLAADTFYSEVLSVLKAWTAAPVPIRAEPVHEPVPETLVSTALSSQDDAPATVSVDLSSVGPAPAGPLAVAAPPVVRPRAVVTTAPGLPSRRELRMLTATTADDARPASPGWYRDPDRARTLRWWTGEGWSADVYEVV